MAEGGQLRGKLEEEHEKILQKNFTLLQDIDPSHIIHPLVEKDVFHFDEYDEIMNKQTPAEKRRMFLQKLRYSGKKSFYIFIDVLYNSGYKHIGQQLEADLSEKSKKEYLKYKNETTDPSKISRDETHQKQLTDADTIIPIPDKSRSKSRQDKLQEPKDRGKTVADGSSKSKTKSESNRKTLPAPSSNCPENRSDDEDETYVKPIRNNTRQQEEHTYTGLQDITSSQEESVPSFPERPGKDDETYDDCITAFSGDYDNVIGISQHLQLTNVSVDQQLKKEQICTYYEIPESIEKAPRPCSISKDRGTNNERTYENESTFTSSTDQECLYNRQSCEQEQQYENLKEQTLSKQSEHKVFFKNPVKFEDKYSCNKGIVDDKRMEDYNRELEHVPGWSSGISEENFEDVIEQNKDKAGSYFLWYSESKDTVILTVIFPNNENFHLHYKVKKTTRGNGEVYYFEKTTYFNSLRQLIDHTVTNGLLFK